MSGWKFAAGALAALSLGLGGAAQASTWVIEYTADNAGDLPNSAILDVTASDSLNAAGGHDITAIGGNVDGDAITALVANPNKASATAAYSADGQFIYDNILWPTGAPQLSNPGVFFLGASGHEYNLFSDNAVTYELYKATPFGGYNTNSRGAISVTETFPTSGSNFAIQSVGVPEPAAWTMMILGFGGIGAILRQHRRQRALSAV